VTVTSSETLVEQQVNLMRKLNDVLKQHEIGGAFCLMYVPSELDISDDEVLIQDVDAERRMVEIRPRKLTQLGLGDVLHATQIINPTDHSLSHYARNRRTQHCYATQRPDDGSTGHLYA
jgi:hypothetical protein